MDSLFNSVQIFFIQSGKLSASLREGMITESVLNWLIFYLISLIQDRKKLKIRVSIEELLKWLQEALFSSCNCSPGNQNWLSATKENLYPKKNSDCEHG